MKRLDTHLANLENALHERDGWVYSSVDICLPPVDKKNAKAELDLPIFTVTSVYHRCLVNIIHMTYSSPTSCTFYFTPFRQYWYPTAESPPIGLYSEVYLLTAMIDAHLELNNIPHKGPQDHHERIVAPLMLWLDSTHLANFGTASLWPFYLLFGSQLKYTCSRPTANACHYLAYIPMVC